MTHSSTCTCTGCAGLSAATPVLVANRPGLGAVAYRVGTQPDFRQSMLTALADSGPAGRLLTTRRDDDLSIGLLDAWATLADVLTFYQERIANESYLRTATERLSVQELARLIGYELQPGVAASTWLAFTLDAATTLQLVPDTLRSGQADLPPVTIPARTAVQSIPAPGELPQTFETTEPVQGRAEWNAMKPRPTRDQALRVGMDELWLQGTAYNLKPGDVILIGAGAGQRKLRRVGQVTTDETAKTTRLTLMPEPRRKRVRFEAAPVKTVLQKSSGSVSTFIGAATLTGTAVAKLQNDSWLETDLAVVRMANNLSRNELRASIELPTLKPASSSAAGAFVFRKRAALFGYNAPKEIKFADDGKPLPPTEWAVAASPGVIFLDTAYDDILPGDLIAVQQAGTGLESVARFIDVLDVSVQPRTAYGLSARTTALSVAAADDGPTLVGNDMATLRSLTVYARNEPLTLTQIPDESPVSGGSIDLDRVYLGLRAGQKLIVIGQRAGAPAGILTSEVVTVQGSVHASRITTVFLDPAQSLTGSYVRNTVIINGNVAPATQGETVRESLGSGDAGKVFQRFVLRQPPLTYVGAANASGAASTLEIRVNDLRWQEIPSLLDAGPQDRVFITRLDDAGRTTVLFGDGLTGARLPTGPENVKAVYRKGIGLGGLVTANQLSQLTSRPAGVKGANNPLDAAGAADRESLTEARRNAPLPILTLGRVVSVQDYADFARAFAGVGKALATWTWLGQRRGVFLTVAGIDGRPIDPAGALYRNLVGALRSAGDPNVTFRVGPYRRVFFQVAATVRLAPAFLPATVLPAIETALRGRFSFAAREFGQAVAYSELVATIQRVPGVVAVTLTRFSLTGTDTDTTPGLAPLRLEAAVPRPGSEGQTEPAELLILDPKPVSLTL